MFRDRMEFFPVALQLDFWREHFILRACRESGILHGRVLDLACGTGEVDVLLPGALPELHSVLGVDISGLGLPVARDHLAGQPGDVQRRVRFTQANIEATGLPGGAFDSALFSHTLEHLANPAPALRELGRLLTPEGRALVVIPIEHNHDDPDHKRHLDLDGYRELLSRYGRVESAWTSAEADQGALVFRPYPQARVHAILRVRDGAAYLGGLLDNIRPLVDSVLVYDDRSRDSTREICAADPLVAEVLQGESGHTDEVRDKNILLEAALASDADWIFAVDVDDRLEPGGTGLLRSLLDSAPPWVDALALDYLHLWDSPGRARFDGPYGRAIRHPRLFHLGPVRQHGLRFEPSDHAAGLHCGSVPAALRSSARPVPVRLLHLGYLDPAERQRKAARYAAEDPRFQESGYYDHLYTVAPWLVPVVDRREALHRTTWSWPPAEASWGLADLPAGCSVLLVDAGVPTEAVRDLRRTRALYVARAGPPAPLGSLAVRAASRANRTVSLRARPRPVPQLDAWTDFTAASLREALDALAVDTVIVSPRFAAFSLPVLREAGFPPERVFFWHRRRGPIRLSRLPVRLLNPRRGGG
jgi:ubiquinone/menaquinone biosynthesis C-methylase UbiE